MCRADVSTYCFGLAASMGAFLLTAGTKGKRFSMPNARIMIHQPLGGASGQAVDIEIQAKEIMFHKANLNGIMAECTGQPIDRVSFLPSHCCTLVGFSSGNVNASWLSQPSMAVEFTCCCPPQAGPCPLHWHIRLSVQRVVECADRGGY